MLINLDIGHRLNDTVAPFSLKLLLFLASTMKENPASALICQALPSSSSRGAWMHIWAWRLNKTRPIEENPSVYFIIFHAMSLPVVN